MVEGSKYIFVVVDVVGTPFPPIYGPFVRFTIVRSIFRRHPYVPHLFRSVYTGTRADHKRALGDEDMKKVFTKLSRASGVPLAVYQAQELFILMFSLRGMPFCRSCLFA